MKTIKDIQALGKRGFGAMNLIPAVAFAILIAGVTLSIGARVTSDISAGTPGYVTSSQQNNTARDAIDNATKGIGEVSKNLPLLGLVVGLAIVLAVVMGAFSFTKGK